MNNVFSVLSNGSSRIKVEVKKPVVDKIKQQQLQDIMLIKLLSGGK